MPVVAAAPCQCFTPGGIQTTSPGADLLDGATPVLHPSDAGRDDERLAKRMRVPSRACARLKGHRSAADARRRATLKPAVDAYRAREVLGGTDARGLRAGALDDNVLAALGQSRCGREQHGEQSPRPG